VWLVVEESLMPRYYFHLKSKHYELPDEKGRFLDGAREASRHAQAIMQKIQYDLCHRDGQDQWIMTVCDEAGVRELAVSCPKGRMEDTRHR
jgi:hypothetical protein